jgi:glucose-1-phosphate thymidylyltransferase
MKCLILAGGFATRLYPTVTNRAKALLEFEGKPMATHIVNRVPVDIETLVTTNKKFELDFFAWQKTLDRTVEICIEDAMDDGHKKGAISAVDFWIKSKNINEDLLVIAADNYFELNVGDLIAKFNGNNVMVAVYDVVDKDKACEIGKECQIGLVILEGNRIIRLDEKPPEATSSIIATGIYVLPSRVFPLLAQYCIEGKRDNLGSFISYLLTKEEVHAYVFSEFWMDIGYEILRGQVSV